MSSLPLRQQMQRNGELKKKKTQVLQQNARKNGKSSNIANRNQKWSFNGLIIFTKNSTLGLEARSIIVTSISPSLWQWEKKTLKFFTEWNKSIYNDISMTFNEEAHFI